MKKVLMIANQFPPMGGSGVQRTSKFVKYLREFGWEPVVFTRETDTCLLRDESLMADIPEGVEIVRTPSRTLNKKHGLVGFIGKVLSRVMVPDGDRLWAALSAKEARRALEKGRISLVYSTSFPYSDHLLALHLKKRYPEIPWVADFRDEWTNNPYVLDRGDTFIRRRMEKRMEQAVMEHADQIITNTPIMRDNFVRMYPTTNEKFHVIPNGFDAHDFLGIPKAAPVNSRFTLTYTGALYGRRKPDVFFGALQKLLQSGDIPEEKITVRLIGNFKEEQLKASLEQFGLLGVVKILPYMKHKECLAHLCASDALLLIEASGKGAEAFYTGKVFEYMNTGRPVLAAIPGNGAAAGLIRDVGAGLVSDYDDADGVANNLHKLYKEWELGNITHQPDWEKVSRFERKALTQSLSEVFSLALN